MPGGNCARRMGQGPMRGGTQDTSGPLDILRNFGGSRQSGRGGRGGGWRGGPGRCAPGETPGAVRPDENAGRLCRRGRPDAAQALSREQELEILRERRQALAQAARNVQDRIAELETPPANA